MILNFRNKECMYVRAVKGGNKGRIGYIKNHLRQDKGSYTFYWYEGTEQKRGFVKPRDITFINNDDFEAHYGGFYG